MAPLPKFPVTGNLYDIPGGLTVGGELATRALSDGITFVSNINPDDFVTWDGGLYRAPLPVGVSVNPDGSIPTVLLLDNDPGLNVTGLQWRVVIGKHKLWWFTAPGDGTPVNLSNVSHVPATHVNAVVGVTIPEIISEVQNPSSALRLALEAIGLGGGGGGGTDVDGGGPSSAGMGNLDGGTP